MNKKSKQHALKILVVGATGLVGSQIVNILAAKDYSLRALIRTPEQRVAGAPDFVEYAVGDLSDKASLERAVANIDIVISTANGIIPQRKADSAVTVNKSGAENLIDVCEAAGVTRFVQSSVPVHTIEKQVPELMGKRHLEQRLLASGMETRIVRNPAFTDVWLVMTGFVQAENRHPHSTTHRRYGFMQTWKKLVGNLATGYGLMLAPGGSSHGAPFITTRDVAEMMAATAVYGEETSKDVIIEAGGPEWLTWQQVADVVGRKVGRKIRPVPMPAWLARFSQLLLQPVSPSAGNVLALKRFVATYQPRWESQAVVNKYDLPPQQTLAAYVDQHVQLS